MEYFLICAVALLLTGCGRDQASNVDADNNVDQIEADEAELIDDSIDIGDASKSDDENEDAEPFHPEPDSVIIENSWANIMDRSRAQIESLREYSQKADKDDPFALSKEEIDELSKKEDLQFE